MGRYKASFADGFLGGVVGDENAMGVFIWATDSNINARVRGVPIVELANANVSVTEAVGIAQTS